MSNQHKKFAPESGTQLYIDIGNSSIKAAYKEGMEWKNPVERHLKSPIELANWINRNQDEIEIVLVISVVEDLTKDLVSQIDFGRFRVLTVKDIPNELVDYETPDTLGLDRFFGCYGAIAHTQKSAVVIDAGTACTIDYMTSDFIYRGGLIMPGLSVMEQALQTAIPALPAVEREIPADWPGKSTVRSIQWGVTGAFVNVIERMINKFEDGFAEFEVYATGGMAEFVANRIERKVKVRPNLIFEGMQRFLNDYI